MFLSDKRIKITIMKAFDFLFYMVYCSISKENSKVWPEYKRAAKLIEMIFVELFFCFTMIILGLLNIRIKDFWIWLLLVIIIYINSNIMIKNYYIKSNRYKYIIEHYKNISKSKRTLYVIFLFFILFFSITCLIGSGILMSYLLSLHQ